MDEYNKKLKTYKVIFVVGIIFLFVLSAFICLNIYRRQEGISKVIIPLMLIILDLIIMSISLFKYLSTMNEDENMRNEKIAEIITKFIPNLECRANEGIEAKSLYEIGIIPYFDSAFGNFLTNLKINDRHYTFCNICLQLNMDSDDQGFFTRDIFKGQVYVFDNKKKIDGHLRIMSSYKNDLFNRKYLENVKEKGFDEKRISTESAEFNENFEIYSIDEHEAFYTLDAKVIESLINLKKKYGIFNLSINEDKIILVVNTDKWLFSNTENLNHDIDELLNLLHDFKNCFN